MKANLNSGEKSLIDQEDFDDYCLLKDSFGYSLAIQDPQVC